MKKDGRNWLWLAAGIPAIILTGLIWLWSQDQAFRLKTYEDLDASTRIAAAAVDISQIERLSGTIDDLQSPDYARLREQLAALTGAMPDKDLRGLYVMKMYGTEVRFMVDSAPVDDPWHSEAGTVYNEVSSTLKAVFQDGKARTIGPVTDEYGTYYSSLVPLNGPDGKMLSIMGADIEAKAFETALYAKRAPIVETTLLITALYTIALLWFRYRQQRLQYIRNYTKRLEVLIDEMPVGVLIVDGRQGLPTMSNAAAVRLLGMEMDPAKGAKDFTETYGIVREDGSPFPSADLPVSVTVATGKPASKTGIFIRQKDGSKLAIRMASVPIKDEQGRMTAVVVVLEDMTYEYEADSQKSEFIAIASHELRTPLTAIRWNTELLLDEKTEGPLNENQRSYVAQIMEVNVRLIALLNDLLEVTKLDLGAEGVLPSKTDMTAMIDRTLRDVGGLIQQKRQKLEYHRVPLPEINIDPLLVGQVFTNFLSNAIKYTPEGGTVTVKAETQGDFLRVSVNDTGIGIPKAQQSQMFKKFFRASNAAESTIEGTGLGLYICKQAIELSGGAIGLESEENRGATFWFTLPLSGSIRKEGLKRY